MVDSIYSDISKKVVSHITSNWTTLPLVPENDDAEGIDVSNGMIFISFPDDNPEFSSINAGHPGLRTNGLVAIEICVLRNTGVGTIRTYVDEISALLRGKKVSGVLYFEPKLATSRAIKYNGDKYWSAVILCPYQYDVFTTVS